MAKRFDFAVTLSDRERKSGGTYKVPYVAVMKDGHLQQEMSINTATAFQEVLKDEGLEKTRVYERLSAALVKALEQGQPRAAKQIIAV